MELISIGLEDHSINSIAQKDSLDLMEVLESESPMYSIWWHVKPRATKPLSNYTPEKERLEPRNGSRVKEFPFQTPGKRDIIFQVLTAPFYLFSGASPLINLEWFKQPWQRDPCILSAPHFPHFGIESQEVVHPGKISSWNLKINCLKGESSEPNLHVWGSMSIFRGVIWMSC